MKINDILVMAVRKQASDVHLKAGIVPVIRKHGRLRPLQKGAPPLTEADIEKMANELMDETQRAAFLTNKEVDLSFGLTGVGRFRVNIFRQRGTVRMVIRNVPFQVPTIQSLNLPSILNRIAEGERGMILVTGVTGSGKSSTLASMIDHINTSMNKHILTIEDPIEFLIRDRKSIVSQRELGLDATTFAKALRAALRQDPDVILIGEMRDQETIEIALTAAETGHLVLSTLHTVDAMETINRILAVFEPHQHQQIRLQIASVLRAVVSQRLARRKDGMGFVPAVEILINTQRTKDMIEDPMRTRELKIAIEQSKESLGTQSFDQSLMDLLSADFIDFDEALRLSSNPEDFALKYSGVSSGNNEWQENRLNSASAQEWGIPQANLEIDGEAFHVSQKDDREEGDEDE